jgi:hypothetical protein
MKSYLLIPALFSSLLFGCSSPPVRPYLPAPPTIDTASVPIKLTNPVNVVIYWNGRYSISAHYGISEKHRNAAQELVHKEDDFGKYKVQVIDSLRKQGLKVNSIVIPVRKEWTDTRIVEQEVLTNLSGSTLFFSYSANIYCWNNLLTSNVTCQMSNDHAFVDVAHFMGSPGTAPALIWRESISSRRELFHRGCGEHGDCRMESLKKLIAKMKEKSLI